MRPQQNRRMRGRGNSNNGGNRNRVPNPLTRNYESNGPDVKIRGNAQHIADKYTTLARDAQASGDRIMAENYLQHAEHYMRIILSAQPQIVQNLRDEAVCDDQSGTNVVDLPLTNIGEGQGKSQGDQGDDVQLVDTQLADDMSADEAGNDAEMVDVPLGGEIMDVAVPAQKSPNDRPRRITRRRLPRQIATDVAQVATKPISENMDDEDKKPKRVRSVKPVVHVVEGESENTHISQTSVVQEESVEKPRRRRRVLKSEKVIVEASESNYLEKLKIGFRD